MKKSNAQQLQLLHCSHVQQCALHLGPKPKKHVAAERRMREVVRQMLATVSAEFLLKLAREANDLTDDLKIILTLDADQEASEQRRLRGLCRVFFGTTRIGMHHRISNIAVSAVIKALRAALRCFTGGRVAHKTLRGAFELALKHLRERVRNGHRPAQTAEIQRETGLSLAEALERGTYLCAPEQEVWFVVCGLWSCLTY